MVGEVDEQADLEEPCAFEDEHGAPGDCDEDAPRPQHLKEHEEHQAQQNDLHHQMDEALKVIPRMVAEMEHHELHQEAQGKSAVESSARQG